jgi:hypothetical protein
VMFITCAGVQTWPDNSRYEGEFEEDRKHGHGIHIWPSGEVLSMVATQLKLKLLLAGLSNA